MTTLTAPAMPEIKRGPIGNRETFSLEDDYKVLLKRCSLKRRMNKTDYIRYLIDKDAKELGFAPVAIR